MAAFHGVVKEDIKIKYLKKQNFNKGVRNLIYSILLSAPFMLSLLLFISLFKNGNSTDIIKGLKIDSKLSWVFLGVSLAIIILFIIFLVKAIRGMIFPVTNKEIKTPIEYKCIIDKKGIRYKPSTSDKVTTYNFSSIKRIYDDDEFFLIEIKNVKEPLIIQKDTIVDGLLSEVYACFKKKVKELKFKDKTINDKNYAYVIVGFILSLLLSIFTIPLFKILTQSFGTVVEVIVEKFLIPFSANIFKLLSLTDNLLTNIVIDGLIMLWISLALVITLWLVTLIPTVLLMLIAYPLIISSSLILPLKQLTINKKPLSIIGLILSILCSIISITELVLLFII